MTICLMIGCSLEVLLLQLDAIEILEHTHSVEVMVYQYDKPFGYVCWMTSIPTIFHIFYFGGTLNFPVGWHGNQSKYYGTPKLYNKIFQCSGVYPPGVKNTRFNHFCPYFNDATPHVCISVSPLCVPIPPMP